MEKSMRCSSVNNNFYRRDLFQQPLVNVMSTNSKVRSFNQEYRDRYVDGTVRSGIGTRQALGGVNSFGALSAWGGLLTYFFNKVAEYIVGVSVTDRVPSPKKLELNPETLPEPAPEPTTLKFRPAGYIQGLSMKRNGAKANDIWGGFRQGPQGNCVTVSAIKAAMHRFGQSPTDIFKEVSKVEGGYRVVMRDDFALTLTDGELKQGGRGSKFVGADKEMLKDAQFLYAVSAKRAQMENNDGTASVSFAAAIRSLNDKEDEYGPGEGFLRLGLKEYMRTVSVRDLARGQVGMSNRSRHSVAVINGREELWGTRGSAPTHGKAIALV